MHERDAKQSFALMKKLTKGEQPSFVRDYVTKAAGITEPEWKCANCGIPTPGCIRACDCTTAVVFWGGEHYRRPELKIDDPHHPGGMPELVDGAMRRARRIVENHIAAYGMIPHPDKIKEAIAAEISLAEIRMKMHAGAAVTNRADDV